MVGVRFHHKVDDPFASLGAVLSREGHIDDGTVRDVQAQLVMFLVRVLEVVTRCIAPIASDQVSSGCELFVVGLEMSLTIQIRHAVMNLVQHLAASAAFLHRNDNLEVIGPRRTEFFIKLFEY